MELDATTEPERTPLVLRPIRPSDAQAFQALHVGLSPDTIAMGYFSRRACPTVEEARWFTQVDGSDRLAIVAFAGSRMVGIARADRLSNPVDAEVAVVVLDDFRRNGVGSALLERLVDAARSAGIEKFEADILRLDGAMVSVFHRLGFRVHSSCDLGVVQVTFAIGPSATYELACWKRRRAQRVPIIDVDDDASDEDRRELGVHVA